MGIETGCGPVSPALKITRPALGLDGVSGVPAGAYRTSTKPAFPSEVTVPLATNPVVVIPVGVPSVSVQVPAADAGVATGGMATAMAAEPSITAAVTPSRRTKRCPLERLCPVSDRNRRRVGAACTRRISCTAGLACTARRGCTVLNMEQFGPDMAARLPVHFAALLPPAPRCPFSSNALVNVQICAPSNWCLAVRTTLTAGEDPFRTRPADRVIVHARAVGPVRA